jgi:endonuclease YncB( thermonuclease family)
MFANIQAYSTKSYIMESTRAIGKVLVDGQDVNLEQIRRGCGVGQSGQGGLWADRDPVPPWEWRKARRK